MLSQLHTESEYKNILLSSEEWHPYPNLSDRESWEALPGTVRDGFIKRGEASLGFGWPSPTCYDISSICTRRKQKQLRENQLRATNQPS